MTVGEWLASRTPAPPSALLGRVYALLGASVNDDAAFAADRCLDAAERTVDALLRAGRTGRESAGELLAADALVTYAFEAASAEPSTLVRRAQLAMIRLARLGTRDRDMPNPRVSSA
jgi:hypothetical protein